jgi:hypothetical protein
MLTPPSAEQIRELLSRSDDDPTHEALRQPLLFRWQYVDGTRARILPRDCLHTLEPCPRSRYPGCYMYGVSLVKMPQGSGAGMAAGEHALRQRSGRRLPVRGAPPNHR